MRNIIFIYIACVISLNTSCDRVPIKIKDYIHLNDNDYLVVFKQKFPFRSENYEVTITNFKDKEMFNVTFDQHNIFFEIEGYDRVQLRNDTIFVYSNFEPKIRISEKRSYAFKFIEELPSSNN